MKVHRLDHIHVYSWNPASSVQFYKTCFGAEAIGETRTSLGRTMYFLRLGGLALVLAPYPPGAEPGVPLAYGDGAYQHTFGVAHFGLHVENLADAVEAVRRLGATILSEPRENAGLRFAYVGAPGRRSYRAAAIWWAMGRLARQIRSSLSPACTRRAMPAGHAG